MYGRGYHLGSARTENRMSGQKKDESVGIWIQTSFENMAVWKKRITDSLTMYGYEMKLSDDFDRSLHMEFKKGYESLTVRCFENGKIQLTSDEDTCRLYDDIVPHLERKLNTKIGYDQMTRYGLESRNKSRSSEPTARYAQNTWKPQAKASTESYSPGRQYSPERKNSSGKRVVFRDGGAETEKEVQPLWRNTPVVYRPRSLSDSRHDSLPMRKPYKVVEAFDVLMKNMTSMQYQLSATSRELLTLRKRARNLKGSSDIDSEGFFNRRGAYAVRW